MAAHYFNTVENSVTGKPVAGAIVEVLNTSGMPATIYSDPDGTAINQEAAPLTTNATGFYEFWAPQGKYTMRVFYDGAVQLKIDSVDIMDASTGTPTELYKIINAGAFSSVQDAIDTAATLAPALVELSGRHDLTAGITIPDGVTLDGSKGSLRAAASMTTMVALAEGGAIRNCLVDGNNLALYAVRGTDCSRASVKDCVVVNWRYGITIENSEHFGINAYEAADVVVSGNRLDTPGTSPIYPIWFNSKRGKHIHRAQVIDNAVVSVPGAYADGTQHSADQLELHGLKDSVVSGNLSANGGEVGLVVSRLSDNVLIVGNVVSGTDGHGLQIGSGALEFVVSATTGWAINDVIRGVTSGANGIVEYIYGNQVWLRSASGVFQATESVENCIRISVDSVDGWLDGQTLTGGTSGGKGVIVRMIDPDNPTLAYAFLRWNGVDDIDFVTGESVSNGTTAHTISAVNHTPPIATTSTHTLTSVLRTRNITAVGNISWNNGTDAGPVETLFMTATAAAWAGGNTITGGTSGAIATVEGVDGLRVYITMTSGTFVDGETATNGTNVYTINFVNGLYAGVFCQQIDGLNLIGNKAYDNRTPAKQNYGLYVSQCANVFESGNDWSGNADGDRSLNGSYTYRAKLEPGDFGVSGKLSTPKTTNVTIASGVITVTGSMVRVHTEGGAATDDLDTINGGTDGMRLVIMAANASTDVVLKDGTGNLRIAGDFTLSHTDDTIELIYDSAVSAWKELGRSDNSV